MFPKKIWTDISNVQACNTSHIQTVPTLHPPLPLCKCHQLNAGLYREATEWHSVALDLYETPLRMKIHPSNYSISSYLSVGSWTLVFIISAFPTSPGDRDREVYARGMGRLRGEDHEGTGVKRVTYACHVWNRFLCNSVCSKAMVNNSSNNHGSNKIIMKHYY